MKINRVAKYYIFIFLFIFLNNFYLKNLWSIKFPWVGFLTQETQKDITIVL